jgi:hypothetical protein
LEILSLEILGKDYEEDRIDNLMIINETIDRYEDIIQRVFIYCMYYLYKYGDKPSLEYTSILKCCNRLTILYVNDYYEEIDESDMKSNYLQILADVVIKYSWAMLNQDKDEELYSSTRYENKNLMHKIDGRIVTYPYYKCYAYMQYEQKNIDSLKEDLKDLTLDILGDKFESKRIEYLEELYILMDNKMKMIEHKIKSDYDDEKDYDVFKSNPIRMGK